MRVMSWPLLWRKQWKLNLGNAGWIRWISKRKGDSNSGRPVFGKGERNSSMPVDLGDNHKEGVFYSFRMSCWTAIRNKNYPGLDLKVCPERGGPHVRLTSCCRPPWAAIFSRREVGYNEGRPTDAYACEF